MTVGISSDGTYFDWTADKDVVGVIVKGGPNSNLYSYDPSSFGDTGLHSPINPNNGNPFAISHIEFCYKYKLVVTKTANTTYTRTYNWTIDKSVTPGTHNLFTGDSATSTYTVAVDKTGYTDSNWAVSGTISIYNPAPAPATVTYIQDYITGFGAVVTVDCGGFRSGDSIASGGTLTCSYSSPLPNGSTRTNEANVNTTRDGSFIFFTRGTADIIFGAPTTEVNASINVSDTNGLSWQAGDDASWNYTRTFLCNKDAGSNGNTATIVETGQSSSASVIVNCYALTTTKDATTTFTRTYNWTIDKSVTPGVLNLFTGDSQTVQYTVSVEKTGYTDSAWAVSGKIYISNPAPMAATLTGVADLISPDIAAAVSCPSLIVPAGGVLECTYSSSLPDATTRTNTATATLQNYAYDSNGTGTASGTTDFAGSASVVFTDTPTTEVNKEINVDDTFGNKEFHFSGTGSTSYSRTFTCNGDQGENGNTATIRETGQSDSASVRVNCYAPTVSKTAQTSLTRTWSWTIDKSADQSALTLSLGQQFLVNYSVTVNATSADSNWAASGGISVYNPAPMAATINSVSDIVSGVGAATVTCGISFPYSLAAGATLNCTYSASLPDAASRTNTGTATLQNYDYDTNGSRTASGTTDFSGTANVDFSSATINKVDECIDVSDTYAGALGTVCEGETLPKTFTYTRSIGPYSTCGDYTVDNTASFVTNDTGATGSDSWNLTVNVPCAGCNHTIGYWKTHAGFGPQADVVTDILGHITLGGVSVGNAAEAVNILSMDSDASNGLNKLRAQLLAAKLNTMGNYSGCSDSYTFNGMTYSFTPDTALETFAPGGDVSGWYDGYGWDRSRREAQAIKQMILRMMECLDAFNNSNHCSE